MEKPNLYLDSKYGWSSFKEDGAEFYYKGYLHNCTFKNLFKKIQNEDSLERFLENLDGHFAFVYFNNQKVIISVDQVRSIPIFYSFDDNKLSIGQTSSDVFQNGEINPEAALSLATAAYVFGKKTLYQNLHGLVAGELVEIDLSNFSENRKTYYTFSPWKTDHSLDHRTDLENITLSILRKTITSCEGRQIAIPLSAGFDSRLIASGLKELGYSNIICFSYGSKNNFEAQTAKKISKRLGYDWFFVETSYEFMRDYFQSDLHRSYWKYSDSSVSTPFELDVPVIDYLKKNQLVDADAIFINGMSGDFISGAHIPEALNNDDELSIGDRKKRFFDAFINKHFALWENLLNEEKTSLEKMTEQSFMSLANNLEPSLDYAIFEYLECINRQSKYVIHGQRSYEFFGHEWRLPLWDLDYLNFWAKVPRDLKFSQKLYKEMLIDLNWQDVWSIPLNKQEINPSWLRWLRLAAKAAHAPLGKKSWHKFEKKYLAYWMDPLFTGAVISYRDYCSQEDLPRHALAIYTKNYLADKGLSYKGRPVVQ